MGDFEIFVPNVTNDNETYSTAAHRAQIGGCLGTFFVFREDEGEIRELKFQTWRDTSHSVPAIYNKQCNTEILTLSDQYQKQLPNPIPARYEVWVCCRSQGGIVGSNPAVDMEVGLLWVLCVVR